jgi:hypothetical protein
MFCGGRRWLRFLPQPPTKLLSVRG